MAEKRTIELEIKDNTKTLKQQYKEAVIELQNVAAAYGETSAEAAQAAKRAAELKDRIEDTNDLLQSHKGEGTFIAMGKAISSVASGFSAVQGGLALMGVESENVQQAMLRVQAAMALAQGLEGLEDAGRAFKQLGAVASNALKGIKTGIAATGIGVLLIAVGALVAYWDDIKAAVSGVGSEQEKLIEKEKKGAELAQKKLDAFALEEKALKLAGKTETEINQLRAQRLKTALKEQEQYIAAMKQKKALELAAEKRNFGILKTISRVGIEIATLGLRVLAAPIDAAITTVNSLSEALGFGKVTSFNLNAEISKMNESMAGGVAKLIFDPAAMKADGDKTIEEAEAKLNTLKGQVLDNELAMKQAKENAAKGNAKTQKDVSQDLANYYEALENERQARITDAEEKELQELANKFDQMTLLADKAGQDTKAITEQYQKDIIAVKEKYKNIELQKQEEANAKAKELNKKHQEELNAQIEQLEEANYQARLTDQQRELLLVQDKYYTMEQMAKGNAEQEAVIAEAKGRELDAINKKFADEGKKRKQDQIAQALDLARGQFQALGDLALAFDSKSKAGQKKAFAVKKAADIAIATIDTYKSAQAAYASLAGVPIVGPILGGIAAGIAVTAGILNVKRIAAQKFEGGGSLGGGGGGGGSVGSISAGGGMQAPNFNVVGNNGLNQLAQLQQQPTQAYVVSGEVTSAQSLDRNRIQNATL